MPGSGGFCLCFLALSRVPLFEILSPGASEVNYMGLRSLRNLFDVFHVQFGKFWYVLLLYIVMGLRFLHALGSFDTAIVQLFCLSSFLCVSLTFAARIPAFMSVD